MSQSIKKVKYKKKSQVTINGEEEHDITINEHDVDDEAQNHKTNKM